MKKTLKFYKEEGLWYIDLPDWDGDKADLLMVAGADTLLDYIDDGTGAVIIDVSEAPFDLRNVAVKVEEIDGGAVYYTDSINEVERRHDFWLCFVTKHVFDGRFPDHIFFTIHERSDIL